MSSEVPSNKHRVGDYTHKVNYGELLIDWKQTDPKITLSLKDVKGDVFIQHALTLSEISPYKK